MSIFKKLFGGSDKSAKNSENKKLDLEKLLSSDDINGSIIELDNYIGDLCSYGDEMNKLTEQQKQFYYNQCLEREINNGGFTQYFFNSSGDFAHKTLQSLLTIGANKTADILQKAIDQFPSGNVPEDRTKRQEILEQIQETADLVWEELDQKFFTCEDDLNTLNIEFVRKNNDKF
ncbi:MAG: DMP19 family protein [Bacteroidetes bacterium]|nr:DMP19 family protein [Bacteroidota bacterium]MBL0018188.1 DMP19 family protein [Bacteroidota bacterium]MBP6640221.1 DMP19 family protein [Bacteroidia bacterium]MBP6720981.1 DMP19 family protein [Bacteroidia bacterium]MBP8073279.1 DMP19 family protein [Bacteroidia bacterium]